MGDIPIAFPFFPDEEQEILVQQFREILNGKLSMGRFVAEFEQKFAGYHDSAYGIAFPSCTSALEAALLACGIGPGDEVLVPAQTFIATGSAVRLVGAKPVFVEVDEVSFSMEETDAYGKITPRTKGAIVVHFGGIISPNFPELVKGLHGRGLIVIEDDAHAHGATFKSQKAGSIGDIGCFSFYPTKIMTTGEGGMAITNNSSIAEQLRSLQNRGLDMGAPNESYVRLGRNNRFPEISAAMGLSQLRCLDDFLTKRRDIAKQYDQAVEAVSWGYSLGSGEEGQPSYWRYAVVFERSVYREELARDMKKDGITIDWAYAPPLHLQPYFVSDQSTSTGLLPKTEDLMQRHVCLPVHPGMTESDVRRVVKWINEKFGTYASE